MDLVRTDLSWTDVDRLADTLAAHLPAESGAGPFDRVIGIARGGLIPSVLVASRMEIKRIESLQIRFYDGGTQAAAPELVGAVPAAAGPSGDPTRTLVVDEITDSGRTLQFVHDLLPAATLSALVARNATTTRCGALCAVDLAVSGGRVWTAGALTTDAWILFPWSPAEDRIVGDSSS